MKIWYNISLILTTLIVLNIKQGATASQRSLGIELTTFRAEYNKERIKLFDFKLIKYKGHNALNGSLILSEDVNEFDLYVSVVAPRKRKSWTLINTSVNGCEFLKGTKNKALNFTYVIYNQVKATSQFPSECPVQKDHPIVVNNFYISKDNIPSYLPPFAFKATLIVKEKESVLYKMLIDLVVKKS